MSISKNNLTINRSQRRRVLSAAKRLLNLKLFVLPIHGPRNGDSASGKSPATRSGYKDATSSYPGFKQQLAGLSEPNLGIATGKRSAVICLDVDGARGKETLKRLISELGPFQPTWTATTGGGGAHYFFRAPPFEVKRDTAGKVFGSGVDVLGEASYAVVPPSMHSSGKRYLWKKGARPADVPLASLPPAWVQRLQKATLGQVAAFSGGDTLVWAAGQRNSKLAALAGKMRDSGLEENEIKAALVARNQRQCSPPLAHLIHGIAGVRLAGVS